MFSTYFARQPWMSSKSDLTILYDLFCDRILLIFLNICICNCEQILDEIMAAVPYGVFATKKIRQNEEKLKLGDNSVLTPTKYTEKYMNSVWGMYNRYSVHNLKQKVDDQMWNINFLQGSKPVEVEPAKKNSLENKEFKRCQSPNIYFSFDVPSFTTNALNTQR